MMQRRNFIKNTILATGALSLPLSGNEIFAANVFPASSVANNFKKSIMWNTVNIQGSVLEKCKAVKEAGFQGIEFMSHMDRKEVLDAVKATGLTISSVCNSARGNITHADPAQRQEAVEGVVVALEDVVAYGTNALLLVPGRVNETVSYDECWDRSVECVKKLVPVAEKLKVMICIENVWNNFLLSPLEACRYVDQFNSPFVKFYFDCGNILMYGWPEQWIKILGERIARIHIKEFSKQIADKQGRASGFRAPLTEGDVDWPKVMEALRNSYKHEWLATEMGVRTLEDMKDLSGRLDKILSM